MMLDDIRAFPQQLAHDPTVPHAEKLGTYQNVIVAGMGASHLAADLVTQHVSRHSVTVHRGYGLPSVPANRAQETLVIASSYSGNTEETVSAAEEALRQKYALAIVTTGGVLGELAKKHTIPHVIMPRGTQPRIAFGYSLRALAALMHDEKLAADLRVVGKDLDVRALEPEAQVLAEQLVNRVPVLYASQRNEAVAYNWKIAFNENSKIPAFYNVFPELNHNELAGFTAPKTRTLSENVTFLMFTDERDHERIQERMHITQSLYEEHGLSVIPVSLDGADRLTGMIASTLLAFITSAFLAQAYGIDPEQDESIETFKAQLS